MWVLMVGACKNVEPAPADLDELLHRVWQGYDEATDAELAEAVAELEAAVDGAAITEPTDGAVSRLSREEAAVVGVTNRDPARAAGVYLLNALRCDFGQLEEILSYGDQSDLYDGVYSAYGRTFDTSRDSWLAGEDLRLDYDIAYTASLLGTEYEAQARGALRRVTEGERGPFVVQRSYMSEPAVFEGDTKSLEQDYQIEVYWTAGGQVVHAYGMWREADFGGGFDSEGATTQRLLLNGLLDWDDDTAELCSEGRP